MSGAAVLSAIYRYPVKSCAGAALVTAALDRFGVEGDRRWLIVDGDGRFLTQREEPALARLQPGVDGESLCLRFASQEHTVPVPGSGAPLRTVTVWEDRVTARDAGDAAAAFLSACFDRPLRLVYMPDDCRRAVDPAYADAGDTVSFADGFPLLLVGAASVAAFNAHLDTPVGMDRFRPNLVVDGAPPFAEDGWRRLRIGGAGFRVAKACSRCIIPSIDQQSGEQQPAVARALARHRRFDGKILFGQNLLHDFPATLALGDVVEVLE